MHTTNETKADNYMTILITVIKMRVSGQTTKPCSLVDKATESSEKNTLPKTKKHYIKQKVKSSIVYLTIDHLNLKKLRFLSLKKKTGALFI